jgi:hypothetical protein
LRSHWASDIFPRARRLVIAPVGMFMPDSASHLVFADDKWADDAAHKHLDALASK